MPEDVIVTNIETLFKRVVGFKEVELSCVGEQVRGVDRGGYGEGDDGQRYLPPNYKVCLQMRYLHMSFRWHVPITPGY